MSNFSKEELALSEIKQIYDQVYSAGDILDNKAMSLLSNSSLILTLFGVLQVALITEPQPLVYKIGLVAVFVLYLVLVGFTLWTFRPQDYRGAFKATWKGVDEAILDLEMPDAINQLIANYLDRIEKNKAIIKQKSDRLKKTEYIFFSIMALLLVLSLFVAR